MRCAQVLCTHPVPMLHIQVSCCMSSSHVARPGSMLHVPILHVQFPCYMSSFHVTCPGPMLHVCVHSPIPIAIPREAASEWGEEPSSGACEQSTHLTRQVLQVFCTELIALRIRYIVTVYIWFCRDCCWCMAMWDSNYGRRTIWSWVKVSGLWQYPHVSSRKPSSSRKPGQVLIEYTKHTIMNYCSFVPVQYMYLCMYLYEWFFIFSRRTYS